MPSSKAWPYPLLAGTKVVVKFKQYRSGLTRTPVGHDYYAGTVLKYSPKLKVYFIKAANGITYEALSNNVKPFDTTDQQQLMDWLAVAEQGPPVTSFVAKPSNLASEALPPNDPELLEAAMEEADDDIHPA